MSRTEEKLDLLLKKISKLEFMVGRIVDYLQLEEAEEFKKIVDVEDFNTFEARIETDTAYVALVKKMIYARRESSQKSIASTLKTLFDQQFFVHCNCDGRNKKINLLKSTTFKMFFSDYSMESFRFVFATLKHQVSNNTWYKNRDRKDPAERPPAKKPRMGQASQSPPASPPPPVQKSTVASQATKKSPDPEAENPQVKKSSRIHVILRPTASSTTQQIFHRYSKLPEESPEATNSNTQQVVGRIEVQHPKLLNSCANVVVHEFVEVDDELSLMSQSPASVGFVRNES